MSLAVAVPATLLAAACFGVTSAVQFVAAHRSAPSGVSARGLARLLRDPLWLAGNVSDVAGFALLVLALDNGPVSLVQPLQVVGLLVALPLAQALGGPRLTRGALLSGSAVVAALLVFLLLVGDPGRGRAPAPAATTATGLVFLAVGGAVIFGGRRTHAGARAATLGLVSGAWYSLSSVLVRVVSLRYAERPHHGHSRREELRGLEVFTRPAGYVPLVLLVLLGGGATILSQVAFQVAPLTASLPAQTVADPLVAFALFGAGLLGEHVPATAGRICLYILCLAVLAFASRRLTLPNTADPTAAEPATAHASTATAAQQELAT